MSKCLSIKTIGIHPLTDALYLHALLDALHSVGLDSRLEVRVRPAGQYHEVIVKDLEKHGEELQHVVAHAILRYVLSIMYAELESLRRVDKVGADAVEDAGRALAEVSQAVWNPSKAPQQLKSLADSLLEHIRSRHPVTLDAGKAELKVIEPEDTAEALRAFLSRWPALGDLVGRSGRGGRGKCGRKVDILSVKRCIPAMPIVGKFFYINASIKQSGSQALDPVCGRLVRGGLRLALTYPIRLAQKEFGVGIALLTPGEEAPASAVWRAQAMLRTYRHRWVRGVAAWERAHAVFMLLDAYRVSKQASLGAGFLVEVTLRQTQTRQKFSRFSAERIRGLYIARAHEVGIEDKFSKGVAVASESVLPAHKVLRLADAFESLGGSVDWLVDGLIRRYYVEGGRLNYAFTSALVRSLVEYDVESLYRALRIAAKSSGDGAPPFSAGSAYWIECLVRAMESLSVRP